MTKAAQCDLASGFLSARSIRRSTSCSTARGDAADAPGGRDGAPGWLLDGAASPANVWTLEECEVRPRILIRDNDKKFADGHDRVVPVGRGASHSDAHAGAEREYLRRTAVRLA
jgi:hypothetical protein